MSQVRFRPHIGTNYEASPFGIPVLIVGESHYGEEESKPRSTLTKRVISAVVRGSKWNFFTRVAATFSGEQSIEPKVFWSSVAFYNFIQTRISKGAKPTKQMWNDAGPSFLEMLGSLKTKPRLIAIFSYTVWENTPCHGRDAKAIIHSGRSIPCYEFSVKDGWALAPKLRHPSRGVSPQEWHPIILEALKRVGGHKFRAH
jgi:hypothetical protein